MKKKNLLIAASLGLTLGCGQTSCVAKGSRVLTPNGWKPIETLNVGDEVISVCEKTGTRESSPIVAIQKATREVGSVSIAGQTLLMTSDHPVYDPEEKRYAPAGDWFSGKRAMLSLLKDEGLEELEIQSKEMFVKLSEVFDITVQSELHNFIAEGILVHNKSISPPACGTSQNNCFSCVAAGSMVLTKNGLRPIENLVVGDEIASVNEATSEVEFSPIVLIKKATREVGSVELNGKTLCMTSDHPVYDPEEKIYAPAGDWFTGKRKSLAFFADEKLETFDVEEKSLFVKMSDVFDLTVTSDFHNFIAEGILVHNKSTIYIEPDVSEDTTPDSGYPDSDSGDSDSGLNDSGTDVGTEDGGYDPDASDFGEIEPFHEHCGDTCPDGICTGTDGNLTCVRDSIGCDNTYRDQRDDCDVEFLCNDGQKPELTCDQVGENYLCQCAAGNITATFRLGVCASSELLLDEINAHCATRYSIQP